MIDPLILRVLAAGIGVVLIAGLIGCFVVWRRMAYFGDSLSHSALLGVALGFAAGINNNVGMLVVCTGFALSLLWLQQKKVLASDTLLGIIAHAGLAIGIVVLSLFEQEADLHDYLFGDIETVTLATIGWMWLGVLFVFAALSWRWSSLVLMTIHEDLAKAERVDTLSNHLLLMVVMAVFVAMSIQIVGILLITAMLIIPAATARPFARSPETMAIGASLLGVLSVIVGLFASQQMETPVGATIVASSAMFFILLLPFIRLRKA